ncbi:hypothetical protein DFJ43DRAFT_326476 [Lentinula guzmanii]|uniref:Transmembrane protein n=1 Tax=Lentinula guzmanii TaxID=2804957 RepID=A0AA38JSR6_9AGAR|nr:hypothetical protein DFJ43DRAFT_326476 [Lentinula guzmanii]
MAFVDIFGLDIEAAASRGWGESSPFVYNGTPRLMPRFRGTSIGKVETHHGIANTDVFGLPHSRNVNVARTNRPTSSVIISRFVQQCWLLLFFRLPALYHSRMLQIAVNSGIGTADLHLMSTTFSALWRHEPPSPLKFQGDNIAISPQLVHFKASWEVLVDDLLQEWKMFNLISALVQTSGPVLLSLDSQPGSDPIIKFGVLLSFVCAGISLLSGSFCVLQFGSMRKMPKATEWMREAHKSNQLVWWNCWILLAMPATWLAWSVILLLATMMSYTWRSTPQNDFSSISAHTVLSLKITVSAVLAFGVLCVGALALTLCLQFGDSVDQKFVYRVLNNREYPPKEDTANPAVQLEQPKGSLHDFPVLSSHSHEPLPLASMSSRHAPFPTTKLMDTNSISPLSSELPRYVQHENQSFYPWSSFATDLQRAFQNPSSPSSEDDAFACVKRWNDQVFEPNGLEAILCMEFPIQSELDEGIYSVYVMDLAQARDDGRQRLADIYGPLPPSLRKICLIDAMSPSVSRKRGYPLGLILEREPAPTPQGLNVTKSSEPAVESQNSPVIPLPLERPRIQASQTAQSTNRPIAITHSTSQQRNRSYSSPQVAAGSRNTTSADSRTRTKRTDSSRKTRRR